MKGSLDLGTTFNVVTGVITVVWAMTSMGILGLQINPIASVSLSAFDSDVEIESPQPVVCGNGLADIIGIETQIHYPSQKEDGTYEFPSLSEPSDFLSCAGIRMISGQLW